MEKAKFRRVKPEIRVVGIDDGSFNPRGGGEVIIVGAVYRGSGMIEGVLTSRIEVDGTDSTRKIIEMVNSTRHRGQIRAIMTSAITFGGFNIADINEISKATGLPVISVAPEKPDLDSVKKALQNMPDWRERWDTMKSAGPLVKVTLKRKSTPIYIQTAGIEKKNAEEILRLTTVRGSTPEPLRAAHLIATGVVRGESTKGV